MSEWFLFLGIFLPGVCGVELDIFHFKVFRRLSGHSKGWELKGQRYCFCRELDMGSSDYLQYTFRIENPTEIIKSIRSGEQPPAHYKLDVESFSLLPSSLVATSPLIESTEFSVGGYRWALQIYPNGNQNDNGDGHISIYLKLCDKLRSNSFINVIFRALIYDQGRNKYLIIQDLREKRFDATNTISGISRALPQSAFNAQCNGFLVQDRCTFGAEVFIINTNAPTSATLSCVDSNTRTYAWRVEKLSEISDNAYSPEFTIEGRIWKLHVYPKGYGAQKGKCLSLYLELIQRNDLTAGNKLYAGFELRIKNQLNGEDRTGTFQHPFEKSSKDWGRAAFIPITDLHIPTKGFVTEDVMILEVCFKHSFMMKDF
ncbi:hypothetical protein Ancab_028398 [Ancistrocladus abbreviatus]